MIFLARCLLVSLFLATAVLAAPVISGPSIAYQFPNQTTGVLLPWAENIAERRDGSLLITRIDRPELWSVDPVAGTAALVHAFPTGPPNVTSLLGITEYGPDLWAVNQISFTLPGDTAVVGVSSIWTIDLSSAEPATKEYPIPEALFLQGLAVVTSAKHWGGKPASPWHGPGKPTGPTKSVLVSADATRGGLYAMNPTTGKYTFTQLDPAMLPVTTLPIPFGINGLRIAKNYIYWTNSGTGKFYRIPFDVDAVLDDLALSATGPSEVIATVGGFVDDFCLAPDGTAYITTNRQNEVTKVSPDGISSILLGGTNDTIVAGCTSCHVGRSNVLYVTTDGAQTGPVGGTFTEPGKIVAVPL